MNNANERQEILYGEISGQQTFDLATRTAFVNKVFSFFGLSLLISLAGVWAGFELYQSVALPAWAHYAFIGVELVLILSCGWWAKKLPLGYWLFGLFAFITGITLIPILYVASIAGNGPILIMKALGATCATFGAAALFGWTTRKDISSWGGILFTALIGIIIASLINFFIGSQMMDFVISAGTVLLFTAFTAYDIQNIKARYPDNMFLLAAMMLYLDFFILFKNILFLLIEMNSD